MHFELKSKYWAVVACILLFTGLIPNGPFPLLHARECMFPCGIDKTNEFLKGLFALSLALIVYAQWTKTVVIIVFLAIFLLPLNTVMEAARSGMPTTDIFELSSIWWLYGTTEILWNLIGFLIAVISYILIQRLFRQNEKKVVPAYAFAVLIIGFSICVVDGLYIRSLNIPNLSLYAIACVFGLRFWIIRNDERI